MKHVDEQGLFPPKCLLSVFEVKSFSLGRWGAGWVKGWKAKQSNHDRHFRKYDQRFFGSDLRGLQSTCIYPLRLILLCSQPERQTVYIYYKTLCTAVKRDKCSLHQLIAVTVRTAKVYATSVICAFSGEDPEIMPLTSLSVHPLYKRSQCC